MKSSQIGTNVPWYKTMARNCKIEIVVILLGTVWIAIGHRFSLVGKVINQYFSDNRCAGIVSYLAVVIGIYVTVWSILSTSVSKMSEELLKEKVEGQLYLLIVLGLVESFLTIGFCVFIPRTLAAYTNILLALVLLSTASFIKFVIILMMITKLNIEYTVTEIDEKKRFDSELLMKVDEIYKDIWKKSK